MIVSMKAIEVCQDYYNEGKGCDQCPISAECDSKHHQHNDPNEYLAWRDRVNSAADRFWVAS